MAADDAGVGACQPEAIMQTPAKYLVIIETVGVRDALLFTAERRQVAGFDAATEEVALMTRGLPAVDGANGPEWDHALAGRSADERAAAVVYTLDL